MLRSLSAGAAMALALGSFVTAQEPVDLDMVNRIRDEGFNNSQVMDHLRHLTDGIGPRLTASPNMTEANEWTLSKFQEWGLEGELERFEWGRGWTFSDVSVRMVAPRTHFLQALPMAWHPGTDGVVRGEVIRVDVNTQDDLDNFEGDLTGKIILISDAGDSEEPNDQEYKRWTKEELEERAQFDVPTGPGFQGFGGGNRISSDERDAFFAENGAVGIVRRSFRYGTLVAGTGHGYGPDVETPPLPAVMMSQVDYDRIMRMVGNGETVELEMEVEAAFHNDDNMVANTIAEIPGRGRNPEIVMAGAHMDSWYGADGAVDNGAGTAVVMEAARILSELGVEPRRTIRFALWTGEEQGLHGSRYHVSARYADRPELPDDAPEGAPRPSLELKPDFERFSAYFNMDNGAGKFRGIYAEGNAAAAAVFKDWFVPFHDLGADTVTLRRTGGTDHRSFQAVGLPAYQFIQDPLDYGARRHHTQADVYMPYYEADLKQASVIMATFLYNAAMRDERMPRKPMPE